MKLRSIELYNLRSYSGTHRLELDVSSSDAPVHLIGGLNGAGKTTFHTAVEAGLFAHEDDPFLRASDLTKCPNWDAKPNISISLEFEHSGDVYRLSRTWTRRPGKAESSAGSLELESLLENLTSGEVSSSDEEIAEFVHAIVPQEIAGFFLFDGEEIQAYTDPTGSGEVVKEALERLMGIHLYRKLNDDLDQVAAEIREERNRVDIGSDLADKQERRDRNDLRLKNIAQERQRLRKAAGEINRKLTDLFDRQERIAGTVDPETQAKRHDLETVRQHLEADLERLRGRVPDLLSQPLTIALFADELASASELFRQKGAQLDFPRTINELAVFVSTNREALAETLDDACSLQEIEQTLGRLLLGSELQSGCPQSLNDASWILEELRPDLAEFSGLAERRQGLNDRLREVLAELNSLPSLDSIDTDLSGLIREIQQEERSKTRIETELARLSAEEENVSEDSTILEKDLKKLRRSSDRFEAFTKQIDLCHRLQKMLESLVLELTESKVDELEQAVTKRFMKLTNIPQAVDGVRIDRDDYRLSIKYRDAVALEADVGSAGQKEVLAFALIWSLVDLSNKSLPVIIDTPLGRLDSIHRRNMIRDCFPNLGSQVIVLSTDEEIGREELLTIDRYIASRHQIIYDQQSKVSTFAEGYLLD